jgi:hypothetical protein
MSGQISVVKDMDEGDWARSCRIEAARTADPQTRDFLLELAAEYEAISGRSAEIHPDDQDLQSAVAERLHATAQKLRTARK